MDFKKLITKITSFTLIFSGLYQTFLSLKAIFFIYPHLNSRQLHSLIIQEGLIEKAIFLYTIMVVDGLYGIALLFRPSKEIKIIHLIIGILLAIGSIFFITKTPVTTDPVFDFIEQLVE